MLTQGPSHLCPQFVLEPQPRDFLSTLNVSPPCQPLPPASVTRNVSWGCRSSWLGFWKIESPLDVWPDCSQASTLAAFWERPLAL